MKTPFIKYDLRPVIPLGFSAQPPGLEDSPDATLLHETLSLARSGNHLELNSQAELNLPGSSSAGEATNYSEVAAPKGCPW